MLSESRNTSHPQGRATRCDTHPSQRHGDSRTPGLALAERLPAYGTRGASHAGRNQNRHGVGIPAHEPLRETPRCKERLHNRRRRSNIHEASVQGHVYDRRASAWQRSWRRRDTDRRRCSPDSRVQPERPLVHMNRLSPRHHRRYAGLCSHRNRDPVESARTRHPSGDFPRSSQSQCLHRVARPLLALLEVPFGQSRNISEHDLGHSFLGPGRSSFVADDPTEDSTFA